MSSLRRNDLGEIEGIYRAWSWWCECYKCGFHTALFVVTELSDDLK